MQVQATEYLPVSDLPFNQTSGGAGVPGWVPLPLPASLILSGFFSQSQDGVSSSKHQHFQEVAEIAEEGKRHSFHILEGIPLVPQSASSGNLLSQFLNLREVEAARLGLLGLTSRLEKNTISVDGSLLGGTGSLTLFPEQDILKPYDWPRVAL